MAAIPPKLAPWFEARKRFKLSHAQIQMARELGMNPRKFGSLANERQERWKLPLPDFIEECYYKRFHREMPETVRSLEEVIKAENRRTEERKDRRAAAATQADIAAPLALEPPTKAAEEAQDMQSRTK